MFNYSIFLTEKVGSPEKYNTKLLIEESLNRGFETYAMRAEDISLKNHKPVARCYKISKDKNGELTEKTEALTINLADNNIINIRLNPPFNNSYYTAMKILSCAKDGSLVLNDPDKIINFPEKFIPNELQEFTPETLISRNKEEIYEFWKEHKNVILKPLYAFGGKDVFKISEDEENYKSIIGLMVDKYPEQLVVQKYIPEVMEGDIRFLFYNGNYIGSFIRKPIKGQILAATILGGEIIEYKSNNSDKEKKLLNTVSAFLKKHKIFSCGIDVIGGYLTEINVTSPGGEAGINKFSGIKTEEIYWDEALKMLN